MTQLMSPIACTAFRCHSRLKDAHHSDEVKLFLIERSGVEPTPVGRTLSMLNRLPPGISPECLHWTVIFIAKHAILRDGIH
jgi:hypothetical protein